MNENKKEPRVGILIVVRRSNKILFGKRLAKVGYGEWGLPGGKLEYRESLVAGAKRELLEETGLKAKSFEFINLTNDTDHGDHYLQVVFLVKDAKGDLQVKEPDKCAAWAWFAEGSLPRPVYDGHKKMLKAVLGKKVFYD